MSANVRSGQEPGSDHDGRDGAITRVVYVIDDTGSTSRAVERLTCGSGFFIHTFLSSGEFLAAAKNLIAGPVIVDVDRAGEEAEELMEEVREHRLRWPVLLLDGHGDVPLAVDAMKFGASDYLERPLDTDRVESMIEDAFVTLDEGASERAESIAAHARLAKLTRRQLEVLTGLMGGLSNKQVAYRLSISTRTVEMHRAAALNRLGVRTIAEVVRLTNADTEPTPKVLS